MQLRVDIGSNNKKNPHSIYVGENEVKARQTKRVRPHGRLNAGSSFGFFSSLFVWSRYSHFSRTKKVIHVCNIAGVYWFEINQHVLLPFIFL